MAGKLTWDAWCKLITENEAWLKQQPRTLERDHTIGIMEGDPNGSHILRRAAES